MTEAKSGARFLIDVPHFQRVALRETLLRGAARAFAQAVGGSGEAAAARELADAAVQYAVAILQRGAGGGAAGPE